MLVFSLCRPKMSVSKCLWLYIVMGLIKFWIIQFGILLFVAIDSKYKFMRKEIVIEFIHDNMQINFYFLASLNVHLCFPFVWQTLDYEPFQSIMFSLYVSLIHYREFWDHYYLPQLSPFLQFLLNLFLSYFRFFSSGARCLFSWSERAV